MKETINPDLAVAKHTDTCLLSFSLRHLKQRGQCCAHLGGRRAVAVAKRGLLKVRCRHHANSGRTVVSIHGRDGWLHGRVVSTHGRDGWLLTQRGY